MEGEIAFGCEPDEGGHTAAVVIAIDAPDAQITIEAWAETAEQATQALRAVLMNAEAFCKVATERIR